MITHFLSRRVGVIEKELLFLITSERVGRGRRRLWRSSSIHSLASKSRTGISFDVKILKPRTKASTSVRIIIRTFGGESHPLPADVVDTEFLLFRSPELRELFVQLFYFQNSIWILNVKWWWRGREREGVRVGFRATATGHLLSPSIIRSPDNTKSLIHLGLCFCSELSTMGNTIEQPMCWVG